MDSNEIIISGLLEAYVMGLCTTTEKAEVEALRIQQPAVNAAILQIENELEQQFLQNATTPSATTDAAIVASLRNVKLTPVVPITNATTAIKSNNSSKYKLAIAASMALLIGSGILNYIQYRKANNTTIAASTTAPQTLPEGNYQVMRNPSITPVAMYGVAPHSICRCTLYWDKATGKAYIMIHHLQNIGPDKQYNLWAEVNGKLTNVGIVDAAIRDRFVEVTNVPNDAIAFKIILDKKGEVANPETGDVFVAGKI